MIQRLFLVTTAMLLIFSSCKKEEEPVDLCLNGFVDPGEEGVDCGGSCTPCANTPITTLFVTVNGESISMPTKQLTFDGSNWILSMNNDTINMTFDLGTNGTIGNYPLSFANSTCIMHGIPYPNQSNGSCAISEHNEADDIMSGFFQADFSRTGFLDTVHVTSGQFENFQY